ncbi:hypothetical protein OKW35_002285 [Paraburkholderia sp. MM5477-R1]
MAAPVANACVSVKRNGVQNPEFEAQVYDDSECEWLPDVRDAQDRQQIKLFTFLVGQQELLAQKNAMQLAGKTQIVARMMVEDLGFYGIRNADAVAVCLQGYD